MEIEVSNGDFVLVNNDLYLCDTADAVQQQIQHLLFTKPGQLIYDVSFGFDINEIFNYVQSVDTQSVATMMSNYLQTKLKQYIVHGQFQTIHASYDDKYVKIEIAIDTPLKTLTKMLVKFNLSTFQQEVSQ